jgi:hypothetical protein
MKKNKKPSIKDALNNQNKNTDDKTTINSEVPNVPSQLLSGLLMENIKFVGQLNHKINQLEASLENVTENVIVLMEKLNIDQDELSEIVNKRRESRFFEDQARIDKEENVVDDEKGIVKNDSIVVFKTENIIGMRFDLSSCPLDDALKEQLIGMKRGETKKVIIENNTHNLTVIAVKKAPNEETKKEKK